jgi:hypothetical protein
MRGCVFCAVAGGAGLWGWPGKLRWLGGLLEDGGTVLRRVGPEWDVALGTVKATLSPRPSDRGRLEAFLGFCLPLGSALITTEGGLRCSNGLLDTAFEP